MLEKTIRLYVLKQFEANKSVKGDLGPRVATLGDSPKASR